MVPDGWGKWVNLGVGLAQVGAGMAIDKKHKTTKVAITSSGAVQTGIALAALAATSMAKWRERSEAADSTEAGGRQGFDLADQGYQAEAGGLRLV